MDVVVDDHLLLGILLGEEQAVLVGRGGGRVFTTGLWYHRLCRAVGGRGVAGALARRLAPLEASVVSSVTRAVIGLPESVGLLSLRRLTWPMSRLIDDGVRLNLMSLEALAAAEELGAELCLAATDQNPPLLTAAAIRGTAVRVIASWEAS